MNTKIIIFAMAAFLAGCESTTSQNDYMKSADKRLADPVLTSSSEERVATQKEFNETLSSSGSEYTTKPRDKSRVTTKAKLIKMPDPIFPDGLKAPHEPVTVKVGCVVDTNGNVSEIYVVSSTDSKYDQVAMDTVKRWKFKPAQSGNRKVPIGVIVPVILTR